MKKLWIFAIVSVLIFCSCGQSNSEVDNKVYNKITAEQAKEMIENEKNAVILDVRTEEEFNEGHIENAVLIPNFDIEEKAESVLKNKEQTILIYCRSGRRSKIVAKQLVDMGYKNVYDFGGLLDWEYETVKN